MPGKTILVISHDATRTGAPILLLRFLRGIKEDRPNTTFDFILGGGGPLLGEFESLGRTLVIHQPSNVSTPLSFRTRLGNKIKRITGNVTKRPRLEDRISAFVDKEYDLVLSNTITNGHILRALGSVHCNIVTFVHELENSIKMFTQPDALKYNLQHSDFFLVPSHAVQRNLISNHHLSKNKLYLQPYYIPAIDVNTDLISDMKQQLGGVDCKLIGAIGTSDWRKGIDLFIQAALQFRINHPEANVKFLWVGAAIEDSSYDRLMYDITHAGLSDYVLLVGSVDNPLLYLACMDVFLMISREDPYPLVVLEAAMLKKPVICFDSAGGASEFLADGVGLVVPYLDVVAMVGELSKLLDSGSERERYGKNAWEKYLKLHSKESALKTFAKHLKKFQK
ncbi:glycosyltransferase family 4 protein [Pontibacter toksunensis]|uniref:Glycosyltransferase family 4 protein n=1 Tax=Pontibacter toksunensis TaxID=1332631 RepID=A0ABW6BMQ9_9BACT